MSKPMDNTMSAGPEKVPLEDWYARQFVPWKEAMRAYMDSEGQRQVKLQRHVGQLQTILALLLDGKTRQALLAWNTLQLHPTLTALALGEDGGSIILTDQAGKRTVLLMDDVITELEGLLREREVPEVDEA